MLASELGILYPRDLPELDVDALSVEFHDTIEEKLPKINVRYSPSVTQNPSMLSPLPYPVRDSGDNVLEVAGYNERLPALVGP